MANRKSRLTALLLSAALSVPFATGALSACTGGGGKASGEGFATVAETELTDPYAANGLEKEIAYLLSLDEDKLLADFRNNAALDAKGATTYGGNWEGALIGGHTLGHYLSALAQAYANAGVSEDSHRRIGARINSIVRALKECQDHAEAAGAREGFLWGARPIGTGNPEIQFDNVEMGKTNIASEAWVPWYTMHKILAGLVDLYTFTGNETAKTVASKLGDWVYGRVSVWTESKRAIVLQTEYGGMNDALYNLYKITGKEEHAIAAHKFDEDIATPGRQTSLFEDILAEQADYLNNRHANTTIPKIIGALNRYFALQGKTVGGETVNARGMIEIAEKFWERVVESHTYVTGANSEWEHFGRDGILDAERTNCNCETCNVYNMLKLSRMLFEVTKEKKYLDFYENAYLNSIWSSQNPETGMTTYFQPMATGYFKVYSTPESNFWCCTGSGMESFTKLNDSLYYKADGEVYVSLYLSSVLRSGGLTLETSADLENSDVVTLTVKEGSADLQLRVPDWTASFSVTVGGKEVKDDISDGFFAVSAKKGDEIRVTLQKTVTAHGLPDNDGVFAFKYGPYVLSAELGSANMTTTTTGVNVTVPAAKDLGGFSENVQIKSGSVKDFMASIGEHLVRGENGKFTLTGTSQDLVYSYHFRQSTQRYGIYFNFFGDGEDAGEIPEGVTWETVDTVQPGYGQYETDEWHAMRESGTVGSTSDPIMATSRYAEAGGSFSYRMAVEKGKENHLILYLAKEDDGKSLLVKAGETTLFEGTLQSASASQMYEKDLLIPKEAVDAAVSETVNGETRTLLTFTFSGVGGEGSARIGSFLYTKTLVNRMAYFVDCGDYNPSTLSAGDFFGKYNSVTDQAYGADPQTGYRWGIYDEYRKTWSGSNPQGAFTNSTWAYEYNTDDGLEKTASNRYTKNQTESGLARVLSYLFELENGSYTVVMYFVDPWGVSADPSVSANGEIVLTAVPMQRAVSFEVTVTAGELLLTATSESPCINLAYIMILFND